MRNVYGRQYLSKNQEKDRPPKEKWVKNVNSGQHKQESCFHTPHIRDVHSKVREVRGWFIFMGKT